MDTNKGPGNDSKGPGQKAEFGTGTINDLVPAVTTNEKVELKRERVRGALTVGLFVVFAVTIAVCLAVVALADASRWETVKDLLQILLPAETGLLGSAAGFYFGTRAGTK